MSVDRYLPEIATLRKEIPKYVGYSLIAGALTFLVGKEALNFLKPDLLTPAGRILNNSFTYIFTLLAWHTLFKVAEDKMSKVKQEIIDYKNSSTLPTPIKYTRFEKVLNKMMLFHDNRSLP
ncbi:MAG: hypothetical protein NUV47_01355 [Patescibacteria group bacterium]|nr:hypothetical protein [Patescibacteria group bacterium]